jgi:predicted component of type VI protein secretion system
LSYLWLRQWATIGSAPDCAIRLDGTQPAHLARILFIDGWYFIEPLAAGLPSSVSGELLEVGAIRQLGQEELIQLGAVVINWSLGR